MGRNSIYKVNLWFLFRYYPFQTLPEFLNFIAQSRAFSTIFTSPLIMSSQTVFRVTLKDGIDGIQAFKETIPKPGHYEALIKIRSVALNYRDIAIASSTYPLPTRDQVIPTSDMAGEVLEVGKLVDGFSIGDWVIPPVSPSYLYGQFKEGVDAYGSVADGMLREYIVLPAHILIKLPKSTLSLNQWASVVCTGATVWNAFYGNIPLKPGDIVLVQGMSE
jgi:NADPH:quinone reductase-like Zn-dependent oxidoreductase